LSPEKAFTPYPTSKWFWNIVRTEVSLTWSKTNVSRVLESSGRLARQARVIVRSIVAV
jgi:hypothetical protein